jgi:hypothetical protein
MSELVGLLSRLPTEEFFQYMEADDFPLNYSVITDKQNTNVTRKQNSKLKIRALKITHNFSKSIFYNKL